MKTETTKNGAAGVPLLACPAVDSTPSSHDEACPSTTGFQARRSDDSGHDDPRLGAAIDAYLRACETGVPLDVEAFVHSHPEIADELRNCLAGLQFLQQTAPNIESSSAGIIARLTSATAGLSSSGGENDAILGDFRILREIGRGGMGIVYEAEQISLRRRVALKVLPFTAVLDPRQLQRFKNEALAAASLDHPNIVEVHAVGCERGVHFYAMRYVEGQTLAAVIDALAAPGSAGGPGFGVQDSAQAASVRNALCGVPDPPQVDNSSRGRVSPRRDCESRRDSPTCVDDTVAAALSTLRTEKPRDFFRLVAELGIQAAEALDHAHNLGIVHRDIKPSNLILEFCHVADLTPLPLRGEDGRGVNEKLTTDRSLPAAAGPLTTHLYITDLGLARIESDAAAGLTMTGDLLGTLRYMSPEQAKGRSAILDHRTDIYSLGITLYELLTLRPAFPATDRQTLLRQIAADDPPPPRKQNPAIPADLETILLKAIRKAPADRYSSARSLADDFRRFLSHQPIRAQRPSLLDRTRRWVSRHAALFSLTMATLIVVAAAGIIATTFTTRAYKAEANARRLAEENLDLAREAVDDMYSKVATGWLAGDTAVSSVQVELLQKALGFYERLTNLPAETPAKRNYAGVAAERAADIHHFLHDYDAAADTLRQSVVIQEALLKDNPANEAYVQALVTRYRKLGTIEELRSNLADSDAAYQQGWRHLETLLSQDPESSELVHERVRYQLLRATLLDRQRNFAEAERVVREARTALSPLLRRATGRASLNMSTLELQLVHHKCGCRLARVLRHQGQLDQAEKIGSYALRACSLMRSGHFHDAKPLGQLAASLHDELGEIALAADRASQAVAHFRQSLAEQQRLLGANMPPLAFLLQNIRGKQSYKNLEAGLFCQYSETQVRLAAALVAAGRYFEAEVTLCEALYASMLNQGDAGPHVVRRDLTVTADSSNQLATLLRGREPTDADQALQMAAIAWQWIEEDFPGQVPEAAEALDRLRRERPQILAEAAKGATSDDETESVLWRRCEAIACYRAGQWKEAIEHFTFIAQWRKRGKAYDWLHIAMANHHLNDAEKARGWYERAVASMEEEQLLDEDVNDLRLRTADLIGRTE